MVPPVAAPDEIVELHDALVATPLDDVETLRRLAWRARGLAAKRPGDFPVVLTAALGLAQSGQRAEAVAFAERAFNSRNGAIWREEIIALCLHLGLFQNARRTSDEICEIKSFSYNSTTISNCAKAAFLTGDLALLSRVKQFSSEKYKCIPDYFISIIARHMNSNLLYGHMAILTRCIQDACCHIEFIPHNYGDTPSIHIECRLDLPFDECLKRFDALGEELRTYYIAAGRDDLPYLNAISHGLSPMPAYWVDAA